MINYSLMISGNVFRKTGIGRVVKLINTTEIKLSPYQGGKKRQNKRDCKRDFYYPMCLYCGK